MTDMKENFREPRSIQRVLDSYFERNLEKLSKLTNRTAIMDINNKLFVVKSTENNSNESKSSSKKQTKQIGVWTHACRQNRVSSD